MPLVDLDTSDLTCLMEQWALHTAERLVRAKRHYEEGTIPLPPEEQVQDYFRLGDKLQAAWEEEMGSRAGHFRRLVSLCVRGLEEGPTA